MINRPVVFILLVFSVGTEAYSQKDTVYLKESRLKWMNENIAGLHTVNTDTLVMLKGSPYFKYEISSGNYSAIVKYQKATSYDMLPIVLLKEDGKRLKMYYTNGEGIM